jgi:hypothetical protein
VKARTTALLELPVAMPAKAAKNSTQVISEKDAQPKLAQRAELPGQHQAGRDQAEETGATVGQQTPVVVGHAEAGAGERLGQRGGDVERPGDHPVAEQ